MKIFLTAFLIFLAAFLVNSSFAQSPSTPGRQSVKEKATEKRTQVIEKMETRKEHVASREALLKEKLAKFRDKRKASTAASISDRLNQINTRRVQQMERHLNKMSEILEKLTRRVDQAGQGGKDISTAKTAITEAEVKITSTKASLQNQTQLDYTLNISSEGGVRADTKASRDKLHTDLRSLRQMVIDAKQSVAKAIRVAATTLGGKDKKDGQ